MTNLTRRQMLTRTAVAATGLGLSPRFAPLLADPAQRRFRIGACDWSIGKMATPDALSVAKEIGLDGVQVSLGTEKDGMHLRQPEIQQRYRAATAATGLPWRPWPSAN